MNSTCLFPLPLSFSASTSSPFPQPSVSGGGTVPHLPPFRHRRAKAIPGAFGCPHPALAHVSLQLLGPGLPGPRIPVHEETVMGLLLVRAHHQQWRRCITYRQGKSDKLRSRMRCAATVIPRKLPRLNCNIAVRYIPPQPCLELREKRCCRRENTARFGGDVLPGFSDRV